MVLPGDSLPRSDEFGVQIDVGQPGSRTVRSSVEIGILLIILVLMVFVVLWSYYYTFIVRKLIVIFAISTATAMIYLRSTLSAK